MVSCQWNAVIASLLHRRRFILCPPVCRWAAFAARGSVPACVSPHSPQTQAGHTAEASTVPTGTQWGTRGGGRTHPVQTRPTPTTGVCPSAEGMRRGEHSVCVCVCVCVCRRRHCVGVAVRVPPGGDGGPLIGPPSPGTAVCAHPLPRPPHPGLGSVGTQGWCGPWHSIAPLIPCCTRSHSQATLHLL